MLDILLAALPEGLGVFLGVVAGVAVTLGVQWVTNRMERGEQLKRLAFEFDFNVAKLTGWLEEMKKYRNAVNGDTISTYYGWFDLSRAIFVTANTLFVNGTLYGMLDREDIGRLQVMASELSQNAENVLNNEISLHRQTFDKKRAVAHVDFWERKFTEHRKTFEELRGRLSVPSTKLIKG